MANSINLSVDINVNDRNAQSKINKLKAGLATFNGMKAEIQADIVGGDKSARRLDELLGKLQKIHKIGNEKIDVFDLNSLKQLGPIIQNALKTATGKAKANLRNLQDDVNETLRLIQGRVDTAIAARSAQKAVGTFEQQGKYWNDRRQNRLRQIDEGLNIARQNNEYREQVSLLKEKVKLLEKIDKANGAKADSPALASARQELEATKKAAVAYRQQQRAQDQAARKAESDAEKLIKINQQLADIERRRTENQRTNADSKNRLRQEISLLQKKVALQRQSDMIANGGKASKATLATEVELNRQQRLNRLLQQQGGILSSLKSLAKQYLSIYAVWNFGKKVVETTGYFEQQKVALEGILGSAAEAEKAMTRLQSMALESPFELKDLVGQTKQLAAYGIESNKLLDTVKTLGDLSAGLGVDMSRLILAFGQVKSAAVLRGQELRQFTEAGIPMVQALADKFTQLNGKLVTTGEVFELISKRQVSFEMVASVLKDMTAEGGKFYNMQEQITETLYGQVQKLKDIWTQELNKLGSGTGGVLMMIVKIIQQIAKAIKGISIAGLVLAGGSALKKLMEGAAVLRLHFGDAARAIRRMNRDLEHSAGLMDRIRIRASALRSVLSSVGASGFIMIASTIAGVVAQIKQARREFDNAMSNINNSFTKDLEKQIAGFESLVDKMGAFTRGTKAYNDTIETLKSNYGDYVNDAIIQQLQAEQKEVGKTGEAWRLLRDSIEGAMEARSEYERHTARAEAAGTAIQGDVKKGQWWNFGTSKIEQLTTLINNGGATGNGKNYGDAFRRKEDRSRVNTAVGYAISDFFVGESTSLDEFKVYMEKEAKQYAPEFKDALINLAELYFNTFASDERFEKYKADIEAKQNDPYHLNKKAFDDARRKSADNDEGKWGTREGQTAEAYKSANKYSMEYDPFEWAKLEDEAYIKAARERLNNISKTISEAAKGEGFEQAKQDLRTALDSAWDAEKTKRIADAMVEFSKAVTDPELRAQLENMRGIFVEYSGTKSGVAAQISTNIEKNFGNGSNVSAAKKDFFNRYNPTDQNVEALRKQIASEYQRLEAENKSHINPTGEWKKIVDQNKLEMEWLKELAGKDYYDIDVNKKKGGSGSKREYPDFFNIFKSGYEQYKRATQEGGIQGGIARMRTDDTLIEKFGDMFGIEGKVKDFGFKIGNQSISEIIKKNLIKGGVEDGVVDFKKAAEETAKAMLAYGRANEKERGHFIRMGEQIQKWVTDTFTKDAVTAWLDELQKSTKELQRSFEQTTKGIDLYRRMAQQGTAGSLAGRAGISQYASQAIVPDSQRLRGDILGLVGNYNSKIGAMAAQDTNHAYTPFDLGSINSLSDIEAARNRLEETQRLNGAFDATDEGKQMYSTLVDALNKLEQTIRDEYGSISGESFTGNAMRDAITEAIRKAGIAQFINMRAQANARDKGYGYDAGAGKAYNDAMAQQAQAIYEQFVKDNDFSAMANAGRYFGGDASATKGLMSQLDELIERAAKKSPALAAELRAKKTDFEQKELAFRAGNGDFSALMQSTGQYFGAHEIAQQRYNDKKMEAINLESDIAEGEGYLSDEELAEMQSRLQTCNKELAEMGENGEKLEKSLRMEALQNIQANLAKANSSLGSMKDAVTGVVSAAQALSKAINKVYDVMNDGENPAWMQDMDSFLEDFGEAFEMLVAPITAVIAMITALAVVSVTAEAVMTPLLIVMLAIIAAAVVVAAIVAAFQQHDRKLQRSIENIDKEIESMQNAITNLNAAAERQVGIKKLKTEIDAAGKSMSIATGYAEQLRLEEEKKNSDADKMKEFQQKYQESIDEFHNSIQDLLDGITGSATELADSISSAVRSSFQNGENAVRNFAATVKQQIGDVVENMLKMAILEPLIQNALQAWTNSDALKEQYTSEWTDADGIKHSSFDSEGYTDAVLENIKDKDRAKNFYNEMLGVGDTLIDAINGLPPELKDAYAFNADTSSLGGGLSGMTEDTGRTLEGLGNSILFQKVQTNQKLDLIIALPFAQIQMSWFKDVQQQTQAIAAATQALNTAVNEVRNGVRPLHVIM